MPNINFAGINQISSPNKILNVDSALRVIGDFRADGFLFSELQQINESGTGAGAINVEVKNNAVLLNLSGFTSVNITLQSESNFQSIGADIENITQSNLYAKSVSLFVSIANPMSVQITNVDWGDTGLLPITDFQGYFLFKLSTEASWHGSRFFSKTNP